MQQATRLVALCAAGLAIAAGAARAHVTYRDLDAPPTLVTTTFDGAPFADPCAGEASGCQSSNAFTRFGWRKGTEPTLGNSHELTTNAEFWRFHLDGPSRVIITFTQGESGLDPAFSVYRGVLPREAHDDTALDPLNPSDEDTFCAVASPKDAHAPPFAYQPHDGFRDTAAYTATGGLDADQCSPLLTAAYVGQFDAFASWSMANEDGEWARVAYVASVSAAPFAGHDGGSHVDTASTIAAGTGKSLTLVLAAGDYVIAAGGEGCADDTTGCTLPRLYGSVRYTRTPACAGLDDGDPCTRDACDEGTGAVSHAAVEAGAACGDGRVCGAGACIAACVDASPCVPAATDPCHLYATTCDATHTSGACAATGAAPDGTSCGAAASCRSGACVLDRGDGGCDAGTLGPGPSGPAALILAAAALALLRRRVRDQ